MSRGAADDLDRIRELRERGLTAKEIARSVGLPPSHVTQLLRTVAAAEMVDPAQRPVVECWVSRGWSAGLTVPDRPDWPVDRVEEEDEEPAAGLVGVVVAREAGRDRVSVCGWLVDTFCLGVKNGWGPNVEYRSSLPKTVHDVFAVFGGRPVAAPLELAQELVLGAVEYARGLGFEPAEEAGFEETRDHLGPWEGPSAIRFGQDGEPFYVAGPNDDPDRVVRQLERSVGIGKFDYVLEPE
jgi:transcriptional regulator with XRE-family HTH domain